MKQTLTPTAGEPPFDLCIIVSRFADRSADIVARIKADPGSLPQYVMVGQVSRIDGDGDPDEEWKAWLWKEGGVYPGMDRHCDAFTRPSPGELEALLNKKLASDGRWWA